MEDDEGVGWTRWMVGWTDDNGDDDGKKQRKMMKDNEHGYNTGARDVSMSRAPNK